MPFIEERLFLLGGAGQYLNIYAAIKIGGFNDPKIIYKAIRDREFEVNENMCDPNNPEAEDSWISIETRSYLCWLEKRSQLSLEDVKQRFIKLLCEHTNTQIKIGFLQHEVNQLRLEIFSLKQLVVDLSVMPQRKELIESEFHLVAQESHRQNAPAIITSG